MSRKSGPPPVMLDGRYIVVRGRLWRRANPHLGQEERSAHVAELMAARRAVAAAKRAERSGDASAAGSLSAARAAVDAAKIALGERGPVWWDDGSPDENRRMVRNTHYAEWFAALGRLDD